MTTTEAEFLTASRDAADSVRRFERQRARRLRTLALGLAVALIAVAAAGTVALIQRRSAVDNAEQATMKSIEATAQRLSTQAIDAIDIDPDLAILLGLESVRRTDDAGLAPVAGAVEALHTVTQSSRLLARFTGYSVSAMSPNGSTAVMARWGGPDLVSMDLSTGTERTRTSFDDDINGLWFHPDGTRVVVATTNGLVLLDASDLAATDEWPIECCVTRVEFHDDGDLIAASFDWESSRGVQIYDLSGALQSRTIDDGHVAGWLGDDVVAHDDDTVHRIGPSGLRQELARSEQGIVSVDVDTNSKRLLVGDAAGVTVTTLDSLAEQQSVDIDGWGVLIDTVRFSSDSGGIIASGQTDEVRLVPLDGTRPRSFRGNPTNGLATTDMRAGRILVSGFSNETLLWDLTPEGPPGLGAIGVAGDVWDITFSADGDVVYITDELADVARVRAVGRSERATIAESSFRSPWFNGVPAAATGLIAGLAPDGTSHVQRLLTGEIVTTLSPCDVPAAIDGAERWLLLAYVDDLDGLDCPTSLGRVVDPLTGELLLDLPEGVGLSDIGPPGTISDGLAAYQDVMSGAAGESLVIRDLRSGELVGRLDDGDLWRPFFSDDGRYLAIGSGGAGGFAIDMARVLAGDSVEDAIVLNPRLDGATTFSVVAGDRLVTGHAGDVLRFWRLVDGKQDLTLPVDSGDSTFIATSPGDRYLYYEDAGPVLRRFALDRDELVDLAVRRLQRGFHVDECERYLLADDCNAFVASR